MTNTTPSSQERLPFPWLGYLFFFAVLFGTFILGMMIVSVNERRTESVKRNMLFDIKPEEMDAAAWGRSFPRQYESWKRTQDTSFRSKHGGSAYRDYLKAAPEYVVLFAGYGFSKEYNQGRGHWYSLTDVLESERVGEATAATCWHCKSPDVPRLINEMGVENFSKKKLFELKYQITHPISCYDCHDTETLALRSLRPAVLEGFQGLGKNMNDLPLQERRSAVCGQCHSTYHFADQTGLVTFPWARVCWLKISRSITKRRRFQIGHTRLAKFA
ncbi:MAG: ammonia-forming cytochrome c nitrite reductase subunit c552 [Planctomycetaceae bacterium]|nr:ammonia-forming cytochrome c nitrite reductase subunit c552 [Planctomycetaceae bacterium]